MDDVEHHEFACTYGADGRFRSCSAPMLSLLGDRPTIFDAVVASDRARLLRASTEPASDGWIDLRFRVPAGGLRVLSCRVTPAHEPDGASGSDLDLLADDVTEVRRLEAVVRAQREVLDQIATGAPIATALDAVARMIETASPDMTVAVYLRHDDVLELAAAPSAPSAFATEASRVRVGEGGPVVGTIEPLAGPLAQVTAEAGLGFGWWCTVADEHGVDVGRIVMLSGEKRFVTADERRQCDEARGLVAVAASTARSVRRASDADARDPLTGLLHRAALLAALDDPVPPSAARAADGVFAVRLDVEGVGACNRDLGFAAGDTVLLAVAEALRRVVRRRDLVARWSGTRFVVVGHQRHDGGDGVDALCSRLRDALTGDVLVGGRRTELDTRLTVVRQGVDETVVDLLRRLEVTVTRVHGREDGAVGSGHGPARR